MLKVELHAHTSDDPVDRIPHDGKALVDAAAARGYHAIAVTLHDAQLDVEPLSAYARERGLVVIPGIERTVRGKHVLLLNFPKCAEQVAHFDDIARLKKAAPNGLVVAPHPLFPAATCVGRRLLDQYADVFDAVEVNAFFTRWCDFNRPAVRWARAHGKPTVGNGDIHRLSMLGRTYSLVDAEPDADAIVCAIREGRVEVCSAPLTSVEAATYITRLTLSELRGKPPAPARAAVRQRAGSSST
jgi:predicted metal-dependent phosphoesterase TrpH